VPQSGILGRQSLLLCLAILREIDPVARLLRVYCVLTILYLSACFLSRLGCFSLLLGLHSSRSFYISSSLRQQIVTYTRSNPNHIYLIFQFRFVFVSFLVHYLGPGSGSEAGLGIVQADAKVSHEIGSCKPDLPVYEGPIGTKDRDPVLGRAACSGTSARLHVAFGSLNPMLALTQLGAGGAQLLKRQ
jgi:hypothetical protein